MIRRLLLLGILWTAAVAGWSAETAAAANDPVVVVFYREGCHDCERMDEVLADLAQTYPSLTVTHLEESANAGLLWSLSARYGVLPSAFPVIFVGEEALVGVGRDKELRLRSAVATCMKEGCPSPLASNSGAQFPWRIVLIACLVVLAALVLVVAW